MTMDDGISDHGWQQLREHIEGFFADAQKNDLKGAGYRPRFYQQRTEKPSGPPPGAQRESVAKSARAGRTEERHE